MDRSGLFYPEKNSRVVDIAAAMSVSVQNAIGVLDQRHAGRSASLKL
jgi:hypothetical protein